MPSLPLKLGGDISLLLAGPQVPDEGENGCGSILVVIDCGLSTSGINLIFDKKKKKNLLFPFSHGFRHAGGSGEE